MKWFVVVLFMLEPDTSSFFVFTNPTHDTIEACTESITSPVQVPVYISKLYMEYGEDLPQINKVICIKEDKLKEALSLIGSQSA